MLLKSIRSFSLFSLLFVVITYISQSHSTYWVDSVLSTGALCSFIYSFFCSILLLHSYSQYQNKRPECHICTVHMHYQCWSLCSLCSLCSLYAPNTMEMIKRNKSHFFIEFQLLWWLLETFLIVFCDRARAHKPEQNEIRKMKNNERSK